METTDAENAAPGPPPSPRRFRPARLVDLRQACGHSVEAFAALLGVPPERVENWESGRSAPTIRTITKIHNLTSARPDIFWDLVPPLEPARRRRRRRFTRRTRQRLLGLLTDDGVEIHTTNERRRRHDDHDDTAA
jgi:transcriptional regulator with XRE-family HTH domain